MDTGFRAIPADASAPWSLRMISAVRRKCAVSSRSSTLSPASLMARWSFGSSRLGKFFASRVGRNGTPGRPAARRTSAANASHGPGSGHPRTGDSAPPGSDRYQRGWSINDRLLRDLSTKVSCPCLQICAGGKRIMNSPRNSLCGAIVAAAAALALRSATPRRSSPPSCVPRFRSGRRR